MSNRIARLALAFAGATALSGCMTMGGNIKGSFACGAPDVGSCAPTSVIDDRALLMIAGDGGDLPVTPAGPYRQPETERAAPRAVASANPTRTGEKVLRVVFPSHIDAEGRLYERSVIHAVVDRGDWQSASAADAVASSPSEIAAAAGTGTLLAAVELGDPPIDMVDPNMPDPAAIAAARSRASNPHPADQDPIGTIRDDVARRLAAAPRATTSPPRATKAATSAAPSPTSAQASRALPRTTSSAHPSAAPAAAGTIVPQHASEEGKAAIRAVNGNPVITEASSALEADARGAARSAQVPTIRASSFPGVTGDDR